MDLTISSCNRRFDKDSQELVHDLACLDPKSFSTLAGKGVPPNAMEKVAEVLKKV